VTFTRINKSDTVISQIEINQEYNHYQANQKDTNYTDAEILETLSESDKSIDSESDDLD
jgi:hypothetical protein